MIEETPQILSFLIAHNDPKFHALIYAGPRTPSHYATHPNLSLVSRLCLSTYCIIHMRVLFKTYLPCMSSPSWS